MTTSKGQSMHGPLLFRPKIFADDRGFFLESWNQSSWEKCLLQNGQKLNDFVQDNHSSSSQGVLRGLHYQLPPYPQGKLVRCVVGEIFDVAIDLRKASSTFLESVGVYLSSENFQQLWIPEGFAHGFLTVSSKAEVLYKTTALWNPQLERSIRWNDPRLAIQWPFASEPPVLSKKDSKAPLLADLTQSDLFE
mgnify:CR=1 FL=1